MQDRPDPYFMRLFYSLVYVVGLVLLCTFAVAFSLWDSKYLGEILGNMSIWRGAVLAAAVMAIVPPKKKGG